MRDSLSELFDKYFKESQTGWVSVKKRLPSNGVEVIGYSKEWIHPDFNPNGTRACFIDGDNNWTSAKWDNDQDYYHTHAQWRCDNGDHFDPTHWQPLPTPPEK